jgi:hypothetical protein
MFLVSAEAITEKIEEYKKREQNLLAELNATLGAITALEQLLDNNE